MTRTYFEYLPRRSTVLDGALLVGMIALAITPALNLLDVAVRGATVIAVFARAYYQGRTVQLGQSMTIIESWLAGCEWYCNTCDTTYYVDTSDGEGTACPRCASTDTDEVTR